VKPVKDKGKATQRSALKVKAVATPW